jgi:hypothetical protein
MKYSNPNHHDMNTLEHPFKTAFIDAAQVVVPYAEPLEDLLSEYIVEAEHQDGVAYWDQFESVQDAVDDFERFVEFTEQCGDTDLAYEL